MPFRILSQGECPALPLTLSREPCHSPLHCTEPLTLITPSTFLSYLSLTCPMSVWGWVSTTTPLSDGGFKTRNVLKRPKQTREKDHTHTKNHESNLNTSSVNTIYALRWTCGSLNGSFIVVILKGEYSCLVQKATEQHRSVEVCWKSSILKGLELCYSSTDTTIFSPFLPWFWSQDALDVRFFYSRH